MNRFDTVHVKNNNCNGKDINVDDDDNHKNENNNNNDKFDDNNNYIEGLKVMMIKTISL